MASVMPDSSTEHPDAAALSVASIAQNQATALRAVEVLERSGLMIDTHHVGAVEQLDADIDLVILMPEVPELVGIIHEARRRSPDAGIVVVLPASSRTEPRGLLAAGVDAVVLDEEMDEVLPAAVRSVSLGQLSVPRPLRGSVQAPALSHRERQIVALVVAGCTNAQIAERLYLAESTVKTHLSSAFRRLGVKSRREAAAAVLASEDEFRLSILTSVRPIVPPADA